MEQKYYFDQLDQLAQLTNQATERKCSFLQHILLVSSTLFAILVALRPGDSSILLHQMLYSVATSLLSLGVLSSSVVYKEYTSFLQQCRQAYYDELKKSYQENRKLEPVYARLKRSTEIFEKVCYISLIASLFAFTLYIILTTF